MQSPVRILRLLPLIRKMAGSHSDEGIRQQAAAILKNIEGSFVRIIKRRMKKLFQQRRSLSETRMPQTTEILRLLRDKSIESKRLAIYMIGKFRLSDMLPEVCECLNMPGSGN